MSTVPARRAGPGQMLAEGTEDEIRAIVAKTGGKATRGYRLPDGRLRVHITLPATEPAAPSRWWQGRSRKFWAATGTGAALMLAGCGWAVIAIVQAALAAAAAAAPAALGALLVVAVVVILANTKGGGGTWTGSGTWR